MLDGESADRCWQVHRYDSDVSFGELGELLSSFTSDLASWMKARGGRDGQRFLLGPDGRPDLRVNACLASAKWRKLADRSSRDYTYSLAVWLNFLLTQDVNWWEAGEDDAEEFLFWRLSDPANGERAQTNSFARDLAALKKFYQWMRSNHRVSNPFDGFDAPRAIRRENVKWLDPGGYARWRDLGARTERGHNRAPDPVG